jgi:hypothetical protein
MSEAIPFREKIASSQRAFLAMTIKKGQRPKLLILATQISIGYIFVGGLPN